MDGGFRVRERQWQRWKASNKCTEEKYLKPSVSRFPYKWTVHGLVESDTVSRVVWL